MHANQYLPSISIKKEYFLFYLAIMVLSGSKVPYHRFVRERKLLVSMATVKAIGFLFRQIMNFFPLYVTRPLHSRLLTIKSVHLWNRSSTPTNINNNREIWANILYIVLPILVHVLNIIVVIVDHISVQFIK